jgi:hypothetical protein
MLIFSRPVAGLALAAIAAGAYGYECEQPGNSPRRENAASEATKPPAPATVLASAAPMPPGAEAPARMTSAQQVGFETWLIKTYLGCWNPAPQPADSDPYVAQVRLAFKPDGSLARPAKLVNPPSDPALRPQAKSVMAAVQNCNPLPVPAQYRPFYEQWKTKTIHFNPQVAGR